VYWLNWSGYLSLIPHTQQLGITSLFPVPSLPCCHRMNWRYAVWRLHLLYSASSSRAKISCLYILAMANTPGSKMRTRKSLNLRLHVINILDGQYCKPTFIRGYFILQFVNHTLVSGDQFSRSSHLPSYKNA
jgi:hypothetical protein